jgi:phytoene desaturase
MAQKAVIIGSGVGGLATALRLRKKGFHVTVFESANQAGGKAVCIEQDGYKWGFGPSLLTLPNLIDELFIHCGKNPNDYYSYQRLDPICKYFFHDGIALNAWADNNKFATELHSVIGEPISNTLLHFEQIEANYNLTENLFLKSSLHKLKTYLQPAALNAMLRVPQLGLFSTMHHSLQKRFATAKAIQLFSRYATYNGSNPYKCPATLNVIAAPEYLNGGFMMKEGMPQISEAMYRLASEMGVQFQFNTKVEKIEVENKKAVGVWVKSEFIKADIVISNMDVQYTYKQLLANEKHPENILSQPRSSSALIFYWGMKKEFTELDVHNIFFSKNYEQEFKHTDELKTLSNDPTVYVFISSKLNKNHAPDGCENWFALVNAPYNNGQDWNEIIAEARQNIIAKLNAILQTNIEAFITTEIVNTPLSIEQRTSSYLGSLYGNSSNNIFSAFLRHPNFSSQIKNLFFCGGSVHPGGGVPLCLLSAKLVDELVG